LCLEAISKGAPLIIKIGASSSYAGKIDPAASLDPHPFAEIASNVNFNFYIILDGYI
jgi:hypothetical protein